ncbi:WxcM-like domain-containing protein [archaeon]|nr:WxcM-like domain-containing protein [archaeon]
MNKIDNCKLINLPRVENIAGNLTSIENQITTPFDIKRVYYLYDVPGGSERGGHAHKELQQLIIAVSGALDVELDDGNNNKLVRLDRPYLGLHIVGGIWRELINFSSGAISLVLASQKFDEKDYIRNYEEFLLENGINI